MCVLQGHSDEVLHLRWSHNHRMLASVSKDQTCVLWKDDSSSTSTPSSSSSPSPSFQRHLVLRGHPVPLWFVCWSLDDSLVLACGSSSEVSLWSASSGELRLRCDSTHREPVQSCAFVCDDAAFVTASADRSIIMRDVERGAVLHRWTVDLLTDLHVTADQRFILSAGHSGLMEAIDVRTKRKAAMQLFPTSASTSAASASNHGNGSGGPAAALAAAQAALASHGYHPLHTPPLQQSAVAAFELSDDGMRVLVTATKPPVSNTATTGTRTVSAIYHHHQRTHLAALPLLCRSCCRSTCVLCCLSCRPPPPLHPSALVCPRRPPIPRHLR